MELGSSEEQHKVHDTSLILLEQINVDIESCHSRFSRKNGFLLLPASLKHNPSHLRLRKASLSAQGLWVEPQ